MRIELQTLNAYYEEEGEYWKGTQKASITLFFGNAHIVRWACPVFNETYRSQSIEEFVATKLSELFVKDESDRDV